MPEYLYKAYDRQAKAVEGKLQAESSQAVSLALAKQGFVPVFVKEVKGVDSFFLSLSFGTLKPQDLNIFTRQLSTMLKVGLTLEASLNALRDQTKNLRLKKIIFEVIKDLEAGSSFSEALSRHPQIFKPVYINMVKAGESSGKLDDTLFHLALAGEFDADTAQKIQAAIRYPLITLAALGIAFMLIVNFVIPKFLNLFLQFKVELPFPTRILLLIHSIVQHHSLQALAVIAALIFLFRYWTHTSRGAYQWDWLKLRTPVLGQLLLNLYMSRFSRTLSELFVSGVPLLQSLTLVSKSVGSAVLEREVLMIQEGIKEGGSIADSMKKSRFFSSMVVQMVSVGEQSGKIDELLKYISGYYEEQANFMIKNLTTLIEPILVLILGSMVLLLALGVFLPMWGLMKVVG